MLYNFIHYFIFPLKCYFFLKDFAPDLILQFLLFLKTVSLTTSNIAQFLIVFSLHLFKIFYVLRFFHFFHFLQMAVFTCWITFLYLTKLLNETFSQKILSKYFVVFHFLKLKLNFLHYFFMKELSHFFLRFYHPIFLTIF